MIARRATIDDVAKLAGVSIKTVSRVFNQEPHVRPATRDKVLTAAKQLDYQPNLSARQLASNSNYVIGMLYDNPNSAYITDVQRGSLDACHGNGYNLLIHPCESNSEKLMKDVVGLHRQVDGLILLQPVSDIQDLCELLASNGVACVRISQRPFEGMPWISVGDAEAADVMTEHLIELGHRRVGFIIGHPDHGSSHDRLSGYKSALSRHGIEYDPSLVKQGMFDYESGHACARELLALPSRPTAIFASNDPMAMGALSAAHEIGLRIPSELSVAGFDDSPMAGHAWPPLTTVRQPIVEVARLATEVLMNLLRGQTDSISDRRLQAKLVCRASTGAPSHS